MDWQLKNKSGLDQILFRRGIVKDMYHVLLERQKHFFSSSFSVETPFFTALGKFSVHVLELHTHTWASRAPKKD